MWQEKSKGFLKTVLNEWVGKKFDVFFILGCRRLLRDEVVKHASRRLYGDVSLPIPLSWQGIGIFLFFVLFIGTTFFSLAKYYRVETVSGVIALNAGSPPILPPRAGVIDSIAVSDGQDIGVGAELAAIRVEEDSATGVTAAAQIQASIAQQDASLLAQVNASSQSAEAQLRQLAAQRVGLAAEIDQLQSQMLLQHGLIDTAQKDYDRARAVAERGFISQRDLEVREETLLARQQGLSQLTQSLATKRAALAEAERSAAQISAQAQAQNASLAASRAQVAQQAASTAASRSYVLRAPVAGKVTALTARVGQPANPQVPLMTIVPAGSALQAELAVPSSAIGFVKPGQEVRLAIDAFPYQRFGTVKGRILTVAATAISAQGPNGATVLVYPVKVKLDQSSVNAYGRSEPLVSGMTLTARIVTEKQSLLEWLFEPLYAVQRR